MSTQLDKLIGSKGADYATVGVAAFTDYMNSPGWYGFTVNTDATITAATFKNISGAAVTITPSWLNVVLSQGTWIPAGISLSSNGDEVWITSITIGAGSIILYI